MKNLFFLFALVFVTAKTFAQIEKPKTSGTTKNAPSATTVSPSTTVEVCWKGTEPAKIKIGTQEFFLNQGAKKTISLNPEEGYNISVIMPGMEYHYAKFFIPEKGKGMLDVFLTDNKVGIVYTSERQKIQAQKEEQSKAAALKKINLATYVFESNELVVFQNGNKIDSNEFLEVYSKNNKDSSARPDLDDYLNLYITFMQKAFEAKSWGLDTTPSFKKELNGYRAQIIKPYLKTYPESEAEQLPEFKSLLTEYYYGILLFEITDKMVWSRAVSDTAGLKEYFETNKSDYPNQTFEMAKVKVTADYQNYLEKQWVAGLNQKYPFKINQTLLKNLKTK